MSQVKIKIKNYRCFGNEPQEIEIGPGFTGLIGLNNSGKSATLKIFYELRNVWQHMINPHSFSILGRSHNLTIPTLGLQDSAEIFNHYNNKPIEIDFLLTNKENEEIQFGLRITQIDRSTSIKVEGGGDFKINGKKVDVINSTRQDGNGLEFAWRKSVPGGGESGFVSVDFMASFFKDLSQSIYIPSFRNIINVGENSNHYDIATGTAFIKQWDEWKNGTYKFQKEQIVKITSDISGLFGYKNLEISASTDKKNLQLIIEGKPYSMHEVGSGLSQFILTFATAAIRKPTYIFIDEPELNLHPALQLKFLTSLGSYASMGVVFATHSLGLARSAEKVFSVINDGKESRIKPFTNTPNYATLLGELSFSAYREIGADCILFVEGITEVRTMQEILRKFGKDNKVLIMSLGGNDMINGKREQEISEITTRVDVKKIYAWIDSEKDDKDAVLKKDRSEFVKVCQKLKIECGVSERRAMENYFTIRSINAAFSDGSKKELAPYELPDASANWSKNENWKIARQTELSEIKDTDLGKFIEGIKCF